MEKSNKRGKIPQSDWPLIMARYDAGETLASIARTYDCSPPAISYVVSRSRERHSGAPAAAPPPAATVIEPQLIKATAAEPAAGSLRPHPTGPVASAPAAPPIDTHSARPDTAAVGHGQHRIAMLPGTTNGFAADRANGHDTRTPADPVRAAPPVHQPTEPPINAVPGSSDARRTLHLSLGGVPHGNGAAQGGEPQSAPRLDAAGQGQLTTRQPPSLQQPPPQANAVERHAPPVAPGAPYNTAVPNHNGAAEAGPAHYRPAWHGDGDDRHRKDGGGSFIDKELRARVDGDISAFLAAFDAALAQDTQDSRLALREATDRLLRA
jgi:hypothetical protein